MIQVEKKETKANKEGRENRKEMRGSVSRQLSNVNGWPAPEPTITEPIHVTN
jgi:hypothetical protein